MQILMDEGLAPTTEEQDARIREKFLAVICQRQLQGIVELDV